MQNADELLALYEERLRAGDATVIEVNKIKMERMSIQTEVLQNHTDHRTALQSLLALNGNMPLTFEGREYPTIPGQPSISRLYAMKSSAKMPNSKPLRPTHGQPNATLRSTVKNGCLNWKSVTAGTREKAAKSTVSS